jgi:hypothetical protein
MTWLTQLPTIKEFQPSEFIEDSKKISYSEDLEKAFVQYQVDPSKRLTFFPVRYDANMFYIILNGTVQSNGIIKNDIYNTHSFCFELMDPKEVIALENFAKVVFERYPFILEEFHEKSLIKKDKLWIKCKHQNGQYTFKHPFSTHQKKTTGFPIVSDQSLILTTKLGGYVDWETKTYGCALNLLKIEYPPENVNR